MRPLSEATEQMLKPIRFTSADRMHVMLRPDDKFEIELWQRSRNGKMFPSHNVRHFLNRFPERKRLDGWNEPSDRWVVPTTDVTVELIDELYPSDQITFEDDAKFEYDLQLLRCKQCDINAETYAHWESKRQVPSHQWDMHEEYELAPYQQVALDLAMKNDGYALFMEQGTGKTPIPIARVMNECGKIHQEEGGRMMRIIILCPNNVRLNWFSEFFKFATVGGKVNVVRGGQVKRAKIITEALTGEEDCEWTALIMGYETLVGSWEILQHIPFDLAVADEAHMLKNPRTKRWKYAMKLRDNSAKKMILTGTPITNTPLDLYGQLEFLGKGLSGFMSERNFRRFYASWEKNESGFEQITGLQNMAFLKERLSRYSFIIRKEVALPDLPDRVFDIVEVDMTPRQKEAYEQLQSSLAVELDGALDDTTRPRQLVIQNILTQLLRLAQITSGHIVWDAEYSDEGEELTPKTIEPFADNPKVAALLEMAAQKSPKEKTIVWATFVQDIKTISAALRGAGHKVAEYYGAVSEAARDQAVKDFNEDDETQWFVGNPACGGAGLNLLGFPKDNPEKSECNANHVVYFSMNWSPTERSQSMDRCHRRGTRTNIRVTDLCIANTIDEEIRARVTDKITTAMEISDVRSMVMNILKRAL